MPNRTEMSADESPNSKLVPELDVAGPQLSAVAGIPNRLGRLGMRLPRPSVLTIVSVVTLLIIWQLLSMVAGRSRASGEHIVPSIPDVINSFTTLAYYWKGGLGVKATDLGGPITFRGAVYALVYNTGATALRLVIGMGVGIATALLFAVMLSWSRILRALALLPAHAARMLPLLGMVPLFALWFGNSPTGAVVFVAFGTFALIFIVALTAIGNVPRHYELYARSLGASRLRAYLTVVLPASLPALRGGIVLSLGFGWSMVIAAEFLGERSGLGRIVDLAQFFGRTNTLAVIGIFIVIYAAISYRVVSKLLDRITAWAE